MTVEQFQIRLLRVVERALAIMQSQAPVRTGELQASIKLLAVENGYEIIVTAPHFGYTEGKWTHPRWKGRQNPNEAWWSLGTDLIVRMIQSELGGSGYYVGVK